MATIMLPPNHSPADVARYAPESGIISVHVDDLKRWQSAIEDAFDLGFKAAGGTIIPDAAPDKPSTL